MFPTYEKIKELADKRGISLTKLEEDLGYSRNTIYKLKSQKPNAERISEIADYFHVSTDYLLGRTNNLSVEEIELDDLDNRIMLFDGKPLSDDDKKAIKGIIEGYLNSKN